MEDYIPTLLWLDDIRDPDKDNWLVFSPLEYPFQVVWVKSYKEFTDYIIQSGLPEGICFDHDLGDNWKLRESTTIEDWYDLKEQKEHTGYDCAKWLVDYCIDNNCKLPLYNIQSANPVGKENIDMLLKNFNSHG